MSLGAHASADSTRELVNLAAATSAVASSNNATVTAYTLTPGNAMIRALGATVAHGGHASLVVDGNPYDPDGDVRAGDEAALAQAASLHINVYRSNRPIHLKAVLVPTGSYLSDRNWSRDAVVLLDRDSTDYAAIADAAKGSPHSVLHGNDGGLALIKSDALSLEAQMLSRAQPISVESESFSANNPVYTALYDHPSGARLIVAQTEYRKKRSEQAVIARLIARGVDVRTSTLNEKIGLAGDGVYIGSANATSGVEDQIEWGLVTHDPALFSTLRQRFQSEWDSGGRVR